jgi:hypothetical protein
VRERLSGILMTEMTTVVARRLCKRIFSSMSYKFILVTMAECLRHEKVIEQELLLETMMSSPI